MRLIVEPRNGGKGSAVRRGIGETRATSSSSRTPTSSTTRSTCPHCSRRCLTGHADVVYGTRLRGGEPQRAHLFWHYAGNRLLSLITNVLYNTTISDMEVGYKAFSGDLLRSLHLVSDDFRFEPEVTAKVLRTPGVRVYEVPVSYYGRTFAEGKKITWRDGVKALVALVRFRFGRVS